MKNRFIYTGLIAVTSLFGGCSSDESPFEGGDSHIISFALISNGITYPAAISDHELIVTVSTEVDLSRATAEYSLCENASIVPDPKTILNWNEEQLFRIQSWNNNYVSYLYKIKRTDITDNENIILLSQTDVDKLAEKKINRIVGNLIIGATTAPANETDPITDLSALSSLTEVELNLVINDGFAGHDLSGFENLKRVGGLYIGNEISAVSPAQRLSVELPALQEIANLVIHCDSVMSVSFPKLKTGGNIHVNSIALKEFNMEQLVSCSGNLTIKGIKGSDYAEANSNLALKTLALPALKEIVGSLWIENFWGLSSLNLPALTQVGSDVKLKYIRNIKKIDLPELITISGNLNVQANDGMTAFAAEKLTTAQSLNIASVNSYSINLKTIDLPLLESVSDNFTIQYAGAGSLSFPKLKSIGGTLLLGTLQFMEKIDMPILSQCKSLKLELNPLLATFNVSGVLNLENLEIKSCKTLAILESPHKINGNVTLNGGGKVCSFTELRGLETLEGKLSVNSYNNTSLELKGIKSVGSYEQSSCSNLETLTFTDLETTGDLSLSNMAKLKNISAPKLTTTANFTLKGALAFEEIDAPVFATVNGTFTFYGASSQWQASNSMTTHLNGFSALTQATAIDIRYCGKLADFKGLKNVISSISAATWQVQNCLYNPSYQDMVDGKYTE